VSYQFAGFFAQPAVTRPDTLPENAIWREIDTSFTGVGVRLPALIGKTPATAEVQALARRLGLQSAECWLYLTCDSWGDRLGCHWGRDAKLAKVGTDTTRR
jgi:hypothetical protein